LVKKRTIFEILEVREIGRREGPEIEARAL